MASKRPRRTSIGVFSLLAVAVPSSSAAKLVVDAPNGSQFLKDYNGCVANFNAKGLSQLVQGLSQSQNHTFLISPSVATETRPDSKDDARNGNGTGATIYWEPGFEGKWDVGCDAVYADKCATLYHELQHATDMDQGQWLGLVPDDLCDSQYLRNLDSTHFYKSTQNKTNPIAEVVAVETENTYRKAMKLTERSCYGRTHVPPEVGDYDCAAPPKQHKQPPPGALGRIGKWIGGLFGDPHMVTFDQGWYDFQAAGEFVMTRSTQGDLEVQVRLLAAVPYSPESQVTRATALAVKVAGQRVGLYADVDTIGAEITVMVNGAVTPLSTTPNVLSGGGTVSLLSNGDINVTWPDGSQLLAHSTFGFGLSSQLSLATARQGTVEGLLGNFDGDPTNDLVVQGTSTVLSQPPDFTAMYPGFANSWRVQAAKSLFDYSAGESTDTFTDLTCPHGPLSTADFPADELAAGEASCISAGVYDPAIFAACTLDVLATGQPIYATMAAEAQSVLLGGTTLTVSAVGATTSLSFAATAGQSILVEVPWETFTYCPWVTLLDPSGSELTLQCLAGGGFIDRTTLPTTGQYSVTLHGSESDTGQVQVLVITDSDQVGTIAVGGAAVTANIIQPGARARFAFSAYANQSVSVQVPATTLPDDCCAITLLDPNNAVLATGSLLDGSGFIASTVLPAAGQYTIVVDPAGTGTGQAVLQLTSP